MSDTPLYDNEAASMNHRAHLEDVTCDVCHRWPAYARYLSAQITQLGVTMADDQAHLDADVQSLVSGIDALNTEIANLKNQPAAASIDFTALDGVVAGLQGAVPTPDPTPAPADPAA